MNVKICWHKFPNSTKNMSGATNEMFVHEKIYKNSCTQNESDNRIIRPHTPTKFTKMVNKKNEEKCICISLHK